ncbi:MAG: hypothetical protein JWP36_2087, partial [Paucimonas sp.]|nr:hypothetical protein [Paucimonas sp.]
MRLTKVAKVITIGLTASLAGCGDGSAEFLDNLFGKTTPAFFADRMADANK